MPGKTGKSRRVWYNMYIAYRVHFAGPDRCNSPLSRPRHFIIFLRAPPSAFVPSHPARVWCVNHPASGNPACHSSPASPLPTFPCPVRARRHACSPRSSTRVDNRSTNPENLALICIYLHDQNALQAVKGIPHIVTWSSYPTWTAHVRQVKTRRAKHALESAPTIYADVH